MLGEALSLGSALCWSVAIILFRRSEAVAPLALNLFKNVLGIALMAATLWATSTGLASGLEPAMTPDRSTEDWLRLIVSGVLGIAVSDLLFFHALRRLGPGRLTVVECAYAPAVVFFSVILLGESPTAGFLLGAVLVVAGMLVVVMPARAAVAAEPGDSPVVGAALGLGAMLTVALSIVVAKPAFGGGSLPEVALIRMLAGTAVQMLWILSNAERRQVLKVLRPAPVWRTLVPAAVLGSWLASLLWVGGFKYTSASTSAVLNQTTTVFTLLLARIVLGEPLTFRRVTGVVLGFGGALAVLLSRAS